MYKYNFKMQFCGVGENSADVYFETMFFSESLEDAQNISKELELFVKKNKLIPPSLMPYESNLVEI